MCEYSIDMSSHPIVKAFLEDTTNTISYVVRDPSSSSCAVIDSVLNFDYAAGRTSYDHADQIIDYIKSNEFKLEWIIETHVHADHLSAAPYIQQKLGGKMGISEKIWIVQETFGKIFNEGTEFQRDGSQFDQLFKDGDTYQIGKLRAVVLFTPGHTPACNTHVIGDATFVGDTLFMPDSGSARADFPGGDASQLYDSIMKVLSLPAEMRLFMCHDYGPNGRDVAWETSVAEEREDNIHVGDGKTKDYFVKVRTERDSGLPMPKLILPSLQVNMRAGALPTDKDGNPMLKVPIDRI